ncbi:ATP-binding protein [Streptomyces sp. NBC_01190]|uniref:ATP-binding protein n=1 Tax=Streptomyces sp. NBC_01190 TaxID=2903767 RepID=UPI00386F3519|nr:ATP-binding protein [Streptomyces sp. NBC_01190]
MRAYRTSFSMVSDPSSVPAARHRVHGLATGWGLCLDEESTLALTTVVSEMVTNATRHSGCREFTVKVRASPGARRILIEVHDGLATLPAVPVLPRTRSAADAEGGRGMWLIDQLAAISGADLTRHGKRVWAMIAIPEQPLVRGRLLLHPVRALRARRARRTGRAVTGDPARWLALLEVVSSWSAAPGRKRRRGFRGRRGVPAASVGAPVRCGHERPHVRDRGHDRGGSG